MQRVPTALSFAPSIYQKRQSSTTARYCQLLGMNCRTATAFALTWPDFCSRGGDTDIHRDGWGLAYYDGRGLRQFHDTEAASTSALAQFLGRQSLQTRNLMAHIRYATSGEVDLANVHPFAREMWGIQWAFSHNGQIPLFDDHPQATLTNATRSTTTNNNHHYTPVGETDSEAFFCALLNALRHQFTDAMPSLPVLYDTIQSLCRTVVQYDPERTILNFLLTCGPDVLWVYSWPGRRPGSDVWNGLHYTVREAAVWCGDDDDYNVQLASDDQVCIVATKPLTQDEEWIELGKGELLLLDDGLPRVTARDLFQVEISGHGLHGRTLEPPRLEEDMRRYQFEPSFFAAGGI